MNFLIVTRDGVRQATETEYLSGLTPQTGKHYPKLVEVVKGNRQRVALCACGTCFYVSDEYSDTVSVPINNGLKSFGPWDAIGREHPDYN